jgi:hypothetical protein
LDPLGCGEEEVVAYEEPTGRFGDDETRAAREQVASGLVDTGLAFGLLWRDEEVVVAYEELTHRFGDDQAIRRS